jgi:hypothetical protein
MKRLVNKVVIITGAAGSMAASESEMEMTNTLCLLGRIDTVVEIA